MVDNSAIVAAVTTALDDSSSRPLYRQLYDALRGAILAGKFRAGTRLPATRSLSGSLGVSRNTVMNAYEQLLAEGYLEGLVGSGTYVARTLPDAMLQVRADPSRGGRPGEGGRSISRRGRLLSAAAETIPLMVGRPRPFRLAPQAVEAFPSQLWARLLARRCHRPSYELLGYGDPAGYGPLREAIAGYLGASRGVRCDPGQVIVVAGAQQALDLTVKVLLDEGDATWVENPSYAGARAALLGAGARLIPVPVDAEGIDVEVGVARAPDARAVFVTPSHQWPLGVTMSLARRLALLEWASRSGAWVVEDDYDSHFRYVGRPLAALQGLDTENRVIYIGSFSKVLFPSLRIGYLVVPSDLVKSFVGARSVANLRAPTLEQAVLVDFIAEGHFARHVRRMRALYASRQSTLVEAAAKDLAGLLEVGRAEAGTHLVGWLPEGVDDRAASRQATVHGVVALPLSAYTLEPIGRQGFVLGYTGIEETEIREGVRKLADALRAPGWPFSVGVESALRREPFRVR